MKVTKFDTRRDLIFVPGRVWNPRNARAVSLRMVLDTAAGQTIISPDILDELGYSAREHGEQRAVTRSVVGREEGYLLRVTQFACLGFQRSDFVVYAQDLPSNWGIDGLLGLSFLGQLNYEVRSYEGRIVAERAT